jgi:hypothetical protein
MDRRTILGDTTDDGHRHNTGDLPETADGCAG